MADVFDENFGVSDEFYVWVKSVTSYLELKAYAVDHERVITVFHQLVMGMHLAQNMKLNVLR